MTFTKPAGNAGLLSTCTALFIYAELCTASHCYFRMPVHIRQRVIRGHERTEFTHGQENKRAVNAHIIKQSSKATQHSAK